MSSNVCRMCNREIVILVRKGSGICCGNCEKADAAAQELTLQQQVNIGKRRRPKR